MTVVAEKNCHSQQMVSNFWSCFYIVIMLPWSLIFILNDYWLRHFSTWFTLCLNMIFELVIIKVKMQQFSSLIIISNHVSTKIKMILKFLKGIPHPLILCNVFICCRKNLFKKNIFCIPKSFNTNISHHFLTAW